jgi:hypothetical protein
MLVENMSRNKSHFQVGISHFYVLYRFVTYLLTLPPLMGNHKYVEQAAVDSLQLIVAHFSESDTESGTPSMRNRSGPRVVFGTLKAKEKSEVMK